jgi:putative modified peptide
MSQRNVENMIGRLVTDEAFRRRFTEDPIEALMEIAESGVELTGLEVRALLTIDTRLARMLAEAIDPRIQKIDIHASRS